MANLAVFLYDKRRQLLFLKNFKLQHYKYIYLKSNRPCRNVFEMAEIWRSRYMPGYSFQLVTHHKFRDKQKKLGSRPSAFNAEKSPVK